MSGSILEMSAYSWMKQGSKPAHFLYPGIDQQVQRRLLMLEDCSRSLGRWSAACGVAEGLLLGALQMVEVLVPTVTSCEYL